MVFSINAEITDNYWLVFLIGMLASYPILLPTAITLKTNPEYTLYRNADLETLLMFSPILSGIAHVSIFFLINMFLPDKLRTYWTIGFIFGLVFAGLSTINDYGKKIYGLKSYISIFIISMVTFLPFYGLFINFLVSQIKN